MSHKTEVALIRGAFLNPNEEQNYLRLSRKWQIESFSSKYSLGLTKLLPNHSLWSPFNLPDLAPRYLQPILGKVCKFIMNRTVGDAHILWKLEDNLESYSILDTADPYYYFSYQAARYRIKHPNSRLLCTFCETIAHNNENTRAKKRIKTFVLKNADLFVCHTQKSKQALIKEGVSNHKIRIVPLGVDTSLFKPTKKQPQGILFVGRLVPEKGILYAWDAYIKLLKDFPALKLTIVGKGPLEKAIFEKRQKLGLTSLVTIKHLDYGNIHQAYQEANILVMPSYKTKTWEEQFGVVLIEAMASGLAIIGTASGSIPEILGNTGILVEEKNSQQIKEAIKKLLKNDNLRLTLTRKARERAVKKFSLSQFADKMNIVYEELNRRHFNP